jgi:hypothetical protein
VVLGLLFLALGYALRRMARQTFTTRLLAGAAFATGLANAALLDRHALLPLALFDAGIALVAVRALRRAPQPLAAG